MRRAIREAPDRNDDDEDARQQRTRGVVGCEAEDVAGNVLRNHARAGQDERRRGNESGERARGRNQTEHPRRIEVLHDQQKRLVDGGSFNPGTISADAKPAKSIKMRKH